MDVDEQAVTRGVATINYQLHGVHAEPVFVYRGGMEDGGRRTDGDATGPRGREESKEGKGEPCVWSALSLPSNIS